MEEHYDHEPESSEESSSSSSDSDTSRISRETEEWSYSLFSDILLTLHLGAAAVFLAHSIKNILVEIYIPTVNSFGSRGAMGTAFAKFCHTMYTIFMRPEIYGSMIIILTSLYIGRELSNFRILRILLKQIAYLLTRFMFYLVIFLHYYCIRIYMEKV